MDVRMAVPEDAAELVRLAALMFESMGVDARDPAWRAEAERQAESRLGRDLVAFVIDHPDRPGGLACSAAGTVADRLPSPMNLTGRSGYVQWVATEPELRRRGAGRAVMRALLAWYGAAGVTVVELHATSDGEPLYRSLGFDDDGPPALRRRAWLLADEPT